MTALQLISLALTDLGVLANNEVPSTPDANLALLTLQGFIDYLQTQRLTVWTYNQTVWPINAGQQTYTLGSGGNFNTQRPQRPIYRAGLILNDLSSPAVEKPLAILTDEEWFATRIKTLQSSYPTCVYFDYQFPLCNVTYWPVPLISGLEATLYIPAMMPEITALNTVLSFPAGYQDMLEYGLAVRLAPKFGKPITPELSVFAQSTMNAVKASNVPTLRMRCDPATRGNTASGWNIMDDGYGPRGR